jgi:hypothetical protein
VTSTRRWRTVSRFIEQMNEGAAPKEPPLLVFFSNVRSLARASRLA